MKVYYTLGKDIGYLFGGLGYENRTTLHPDHAYDELEISGGISLKVPYQMTLRLTGECSDRDYDNVDSTYAVTRDDKKYRGSVSLSRNIFHEWLSVVGELDYTKRDSNITDYKYTRKTATLSLTARF